MAQSSDISLPWAVTVFVSVLMLLAGGTWLAITLITSYVMHSEAERTALDWARYLASNVTDLENIAAGEEPSTTSMIFFHSTRYAGQVFRYAIYNPHGYSQLIASREKVAPVDLSEYDPDAARAAASREPIVDLEERGGPDTPPIFARAYVPAIVNDRVVAVVAAYVDETAQQALYGRAALVGAAAIWTMAGFAFGIPAIAWYFRTKEKQQADRRIHFLAHHDPLTGLANRARLIEYLNAALAALPSPGEGLAIHFVDLDHFKDINDMFGHDAGDFLLTAVGQRLRNLTRVEDIVARIGGDEFVVVQSHVTGRDQAEALARRIMAQLREPVYYKEQEIKTEVTIGIALAPEDGTSAERLLKSADLALYHGKAAGRNCLRFFAPEMDEALRQRINLERRLRNAVATGGFVLHYQPLFAMKGRQLVGFEALLRLPEEDGTLIPPNRFIPLAEELHLLDRIGAWTLREACRTAKGWPKELTVAVNLSPSQFEAGTLPSIVAEALRESGLEPNRLELEITETALLHNTEKTLAQLRELKEMGVSIVMDDFGTGYSSLSYLWKFPFDKIKIDRSFMESFEASGRNVETVVKTIIALGRELQMRVTVEGVETAAQVDFLYDVHADQVQGFYFGPPVPADEVASKLLTMQLQQTVRSGERPENRPN